MRSRSLFGNRPTAGLLGLAVGAVGLFTLFSQPAVAQTAGPAQPGAPAQPAAAAQPSVTGAAPSSGVQSVAIRPTETSPNDPNGGQWFVFELAPGQSHSTKARIANPADVPQTVQLTIHDLTFTPAGAPGINDGTQQDVGLWGGFDQQSVTIPPKSEVEVPFHVTVPDNAEPGDHAGVVMATTTATATTGNFRVVTRVAVRMYVTVPGEATKAFEVTSVAAKPDSTFLPNYELVTVRLHNTGRIRLHPAVTVGGEKATGSDTILARSYEDYHARIPVGMWGGPVAEKVVVTTDAGLTKVVGHSQFVIPWVLISAVLLGALLLVGLALVLRRRQRRLAALRADLRRLEQLVAERPSAGPSAPMAVPPVDSGTEIRSLETAIKRARRTGHPETLGDLAVALHEAGGDALDALLEALAQPASPRADELVAAARAYPVNRLDASNRLRTLPPAIVERLTVHRPAAAGRRTRGDAAATPLPEAPAATGGRASSV